MQSVQYQSIHTKLQQSTCSQIFAKLHSCLWKHPNVWWPLQSDWLQRKVFCCCTQRQSGRHNLYWSAPTRLLYTYFWNTTLIITLINISLKTPLMIIPHRHHLQLFVPGPDVGFSDLIVSFIHIMCARSLYNSLEGELCRVSLLSIDLCSYLCDHPVFNITFVVHYQITMCWIDIIKEFMLVK